MPNGAMHEVCVKRSPKASTTDFGSFEDSSTLRINNSAHDVTDSHAGCTLKLNLAPIAPATTVPAPLAASYDGRFTGLNTIALKPQGAGLPVLTVARAQRQSDTRAKTC